MQLQRSTSHNWLAAAVVAVVLVVGSGTETFTGLLGGSPAHAQSEEAGETDEGDEADGEEATEARAPDDLSAEEVARRIQKFYKETEDFQSSFKQTYRDVAAGEEKVRWGKVYFKKPGKMRWDYYEGEALEERKKTLVSDGTNFWAYELEFQQVFKRCLENSKLPTSLKFLMGQGNLLEDFDVAFTDDSTADRPGLELIPKESTPKYEKVHFYLDPESFQVEQTVVFDPYENTNTINFRETSLNQDLPDSGFEFEPPEGARLVNKQKDCD